MTLPELCIRRPVMTTLLMLAFVVFGLFAYRLLPVAALPRVDFPTIFVIAQLPGAGPETMASAVATPLEKQFSNIAGIDSMVSSSGQGATGITIQFNLGRNIDGAALDVESEISAAARYLPPQLPAPPSFIKLNPADQPVMNLALVSSTLPLYAMDEYAETLMAQRISMLPGVSQVQVYGAQKRAVRIQANPEALAAKGLSFDDVMGAVAAANTITPVGQINGAHIGYTIEGNDQLAWAKDFKPIVIAYRNGAPVRVRDVANVVDAPENNLVAGWYDGQRSIILAIFRQPDANTVAVVDSVKALLPEFRLQIPPSVQVKVLVDRSLSIRNSVSDVQFTLMLTVFLVVMVIFIFLRNVTATLIPALALPVSVIGTFGGMYLMGYSIDNLSLLALTLSVGFVVDDAIVMLENIVRHIEEGEKPLEAAFNGSREIGFTIISITFSLVAVFIPVLFMAGIVGRVFREFAVTISMTILISGLVSLTLTPMLASRMLRSEHDRRHGLLYRISEAGFNGLIGGYDWMLTRVLRFKLVTLGVTILSLAASLYAFDVIPKGFFPNEDTGLIFGTVEAVQDISFSNMADHQKQVSAIVQADPAVADVGTFIGASPFNPAFNNGRMFITLKPRNVRKEDIQQVIQRLRRKVSQVPGTITYFQAIQNINVGGRLSRSQYQYTVQDSDTKQLYEIAPKLQAGIEKLPGIQDVNSDLELKNRQLVVEVNRDLASSLGITVDQVRSTLYSAYGVRQISTIYQPANDYQVILEVDPKYQQTPSDLLKLYLRTSNNQPIPLSAIATLRTTLGPVLINHQGLLPAVTISFNLAPGVSLGQAVEEIRQLERRMNLPVTVATGFQGTAQVFQQSLKGQGMLLIAAILVIYMVLGILYESFIHPITILSGLPAAGLGALLTLMLFSMDLSIIAIIGIVMLIGIVKKNAIMMIDFAIARQRESITTPEHAIHEACLLRFRPIMMTTMAAIMGGLPIAIGLGEGSELRRPLGLAVVGGLLVSQALTLFITPVIYVYLERVRRFFGREEQPALQTDAAIANRHVAQPGE
ncbi:MAG TPA: efflux RND transporter permease subunit [Stellaceae bacterium]|nr:efflux RND transporter permease subunit [Stellaceae bacterium]